MQFAGVDPSPPPVIDIPRQCMELLDLEKPALDTCAEPRLGQVAEQEFRVLATSARKTPLRSARFEAEIALLPFCPRRFGPLTRFVVAREAFSGTIEFAVTRFCAVSSSDRMHWRSNSPESREFVGP